MTDAERQLLHAYEQWRGLSLVEGEAIRAGDWPHVETCQVAKARLQARITAATAAMRLHAARDGETAVVEGRLREVISDLLARERQNESALAAQYRRAREEHAGLNQSVRNLRQVRRAYVGSAPPGWHSYS
jgi:hypothetical protein